ncbi:hypothetical protein [Shewanella putrefaciens]|uniref:Uncharacterized protein n=1 Tax=Shewanella putrefaciens (strain 200) TaxID=399804 RepID=E6XN39_SHEP2|nr:hypothetical protein [Shewanella putrefaciens]MDR6963150.1 hypothetical protein [Shewanella putrefaciens]
MPPTVTVATVTILTNPIAVRLAKKLLPLSVPRLEDQPFVI